MAGWTKWSVVPSALLVAALVGTGSPADAQTPATFERRSNEVRFQIDFQVPAAALAALLPPGFTSDVATAGPAKDCNLRVIFIDEVSINGPDNRAIGRGTNQLVYLTAPVKDPSGASAQLVVGGLTADATAAPGPSGNYLPATTHTVTRRVEAPATGNGPVMETQDWVFRTATGEHLEMHITFERGGANYRPEYQRVFYSAANPAMVRVSHEQLVLDILRNTTTNPPDRVSAYTFSGGGGRYAGLFDGTEQTLSWDSILWMNRTEGAR
jgi:hypothetical protein